MRCHLLVILSALCILVAFGRPLHRAVDVDSALAWATATVQQQRLHGTRDQCDPVEPSYCTPFIGFKLDTEALTYAQRNELCSKLHAIGRNLHVSTEYAGPFKCSAVAWETTQHYHYIEP